MNKRRIILGSAFFILVAILIGAALMMMNRDPVESYQSYVGSKYQLNRDSLVTYEINSHHVTFITDNHYYTHIFYSEPGGSIINYLSIPRGTPERKRVYWHTSSKNGSVMFTSVLYDEVIDHITVKAVDGQEMREELKPIHYNDTRFVIAVSDRIERNPVDITGYSKEDEVVYRNIKEKYDKELFKR
ncbi:hypothetical protein [Paenibacillus thiaminolyticus]|uniref:hypothetical protein n=1 Tax=Paenibacillus thiaminolyticus TaxID=49283 RepID=UPI00254296F8|nr:hypothetical protein [Paenibacillus thiaminolyticus]WII37372.1 hypothetical protein O0V01_27960 [Paenibacillus thiaminolyticus]